MPATIWLQVSLVKSFECMWWAAILHHWDDDVDLLYHCNVLVSLFSVSCFLSFKEHVFQVVASKYKLCNIENGKQQCLGI